MIKTVIKKRGGTEFKCSVTSISNYMDLVKVEVQIVGGIESGLLTCSKKHARITQRRLIKSILNK